MEEVDAACPMRQPPSGNTGVSEKFGSVVTFPQSGPAFGSMRKDSIGLHRMEKLPTRRFTCNRLIPISSRHMKFSRDKFIGLSGRSTGSPLDICLRPKYTAAAGFIPNPFRIITSYVVRRQRRYCSALMQILASFGTVTQPGS
ncbi:MAG: hypothetical protein ACKVHE_14845 [Planctomycetales bacterium]|jgi:hypothetical protein